MKKMIIRIGKSGETTIRVEGASGPECEVFTRKVERAIGVLEKREYTEAYDAEEGVTVSAAERVGESVGPGRAGDELAAERKRRPPAKRRGLALMRATDALGWVEWMERGRPSPVVVNPKDGSILLYVPAGASEMGSLTGSCDEQPVHRVYLDAFHVGAYCVTNAQYARFVDATGHRPPDQADYGDPVWQGRKFPPEKADHPVVCVSWEDASAYAQWSGLSLPTEAQWERAARGPQGLEYPWGKDWDASRCRHDKNRGSEQMATVSAYPAGVSGEGAYNLSGNVWEWCADSYDSGYYAKSARENPSGPERGTGRVRRGGCWGGDGPTSFRAAYRHGYDPGGRWSHQAFRLVTQLASLPSETGPSRGVGVGGGRGSAAR